MFRRGEVGGPRHACGVAQHVRVAVYDVLGRQVAQLFDGPLSAEQVEAAVADSARFDVFTLVDVALLNSQSTSSGGGILVTAGALTATAVTSAAATPTSSATFKRTRSTRPSTRSRDWVRWRSASVSAAGQVGTTSSCGPTPS